MKRTFSLLIVIFAITTVTATSCFKIKSTGEQPSSNNTEEGRFNLSSTDDLYKFLTYSERRVPLISAHRGGPTESYPENAIETFQHIATKMPVIIECDIALTRDSALVLMHDETLERTTTGKGKVNEHSLAEIKKLHLEDNDGTLTPFRVPTLEEALDWGVGKVIFTLDVKKNVPYNLVINEVRNAGAEAHAIIITYSTG
ncbi:MAG: glycerophosphodiester phosphodiesterase family protein, partial [Sphingobacterium sp.]